MNTIFTRIPYGFKVVLFLSVGILVSALASERAFADSWRVQPLADEYVELFHSPDSKRIFIYSPGLARCPNGRLIATFDISARNGATLENIAVEKTSRSSIGKIYSSDDHGKTWTYRADFPFVHARPLVAGNALYVLGHSGDLMVMRSDDWGTTWSKPVKLTQDQNWHQAPCSVHHANGNVYLVMERRTVNLSEAWPVSELAPVLMRGKVDADLTKKENWTFASEMNFRDAIIDRDLNSFGVPFFPYFYPESGEPAKGRGCASIGWLETNVVQIVDPDHYWYDPAGKTFHLFMRAHTGGTGYAALAKVVEQEDGSMITQLEMVPSGKKIAFVPLPGGQMKFHILYDDQTRLYWLLSTQATDSMTRADRLPDNRYNLPNNERRRLQLHFSKNCIDWCFAGLVAVGPVEQASRHYASMVIDGDDLHILSRSGDKEAKDPHNGNMITFHTVRDFGSLVY